jgi:hypothetical protein
MVGPVRNWAGLLLRLVIRRVSRHGNLASSNDGIDEATRSNGCETDLYYLIEYTAAAALLCELAYIRRNFFFQVCRLRPDRFKEA